MLNEANVCKLIKKNSRIGGMAMGSVDDGDVKDFMFLIDGYIAVHASKYDRKVISKLVEFGHLRADCTFTNPQPNLLDMVGKPAGEAAALTPLYVEAQIGGKNTLLRFLQNSNNVGTYQNRYMECFEGVTYKMADALSFLYVMREDIVEGVIAPSRIKQDFLSGFVTKLMPTIAITVSKDDGNWGACSGCGRLERLRNWQDYRHCPVCGAQIKRG